MDPVVRWRAALALVLSLGACTRAIDPATTALASAQSRPFDLVSDGRFICWSWERGASCMPAAGGPVRKYEAAGGRLALRDGKLWSNGGGSQVTLTELPDGPTRVLVDSLPSGQGFVVDAEGALAWTAAGTTGRIVRITPEGATRPLVEFTTTLQLDPKTASAGLLAVDADALYYVDDVGTVRRIHRLDKRTQKDVVLVAESMVWGLGLDGARLFFLRSGGLCEVPATAPGKARCSEPGFGASRDLYVVRGAKAYGREVNFGLDGPGYERSPTGSYLDVCDGWGTASSCRRYFSDFQGSGLVVEGATVLTFRQKARGASWELVRFTPR